MIAHTSLPFRRIISTATLAVLLLSVLASSSLWGANEHINGKWRSPFPMRDSIAHTDSGEVAVHMLLLRGRADSSHVLYWTHGYSARLMLNATAGSSARHVNVPSGSPTDPNYVENLTSGHRAGAVLEDTYGQPRYTST